MGVCVALHEVIPKNRAQTTISSIVSKIRSSGARVILVFAVQQDAAALFGEALRHELFRIFYTTLLFKMQYKFDIDFWFVVFLRIQIY